MDVIEDYREELYRKKDRLSQRILASCVTLDTLVQDGFERVYLELNSESYLRRDWRRLAGKLLVPPPNTACMEKLSNTSEQDGPAYKLLKTWVVQNYGPNTFEFLIATMIESRLYSACDELLDFLENCTTDLEHLGELADELTRNSDGFVCVDEVATECKADGTSPTVNEQHQTTAEIQPNSNISIDGETESEKRTESGEVSSVENSFTECNVDEHTENIQNQQERRRQTDTQIGSNNTPSLERSNSWPVRRTRRWRSLIRRLFRSRSSPQQEISSPTSPRIPQEPSIAPVTQNEIFIVSSHSDNETEGMRDLMSFVYNLQPVKKGELIVKTIHDDQNGLVTTTWLEERVRCAKFVVLCFSKTVKAIADHRLGLPPFDHQVDINLKYTLDFLVTNTIRMAGCRNEGGKFVPVLLPDNDYSSIIIPLNAFLYFSWPKENRKISNHIMNLPDYPAPPQGTRLQLVQRQFVVG